MDEVLDELVFTLKPAGRPKVGFLAFETGVDRTVLKDRLEEALEELEFIELDLSDKRVTSLAKALRENLPKRVLQGQPVTHLVNITGLERSLLPDRNGDGPTRLPAALNFEREVIFRDFPFSILIWTNEFLVDRLRRKARDFWSWVTCYYHLTKAISKAGRTTQPHDFYNPQNWITVEPGTFLMGSKSGSDHDGPPHGVTINQLFYMTRVPVTNQLYETFIAEGGYRESSWWSEGGKQFLERSGISAPLDWSPPRDDTVYLPVVGVSWYEANAFCRWFTYKIMERKPSIWPDKIRVRIPSEAEWEYAARGAEGRTYPWGEEKPGMAHANFGYRLDGPSPVDTYPKGRTPDGISDMAGNVSTWCLDDWKFDYHLQVGDGAVDPILETGATARSIRGGDWRAHQLEAYRRDWAEAETRAANIGIRLVSVPSID